MILLSKETEKERERREGAASLALANPIWMLRFWRTLERRKPYLLRSIRRFFFRGGMHRLLDLFRFRCPERDATML